MCISSQGVSLTKKQAFNFCEMSCLSRDQEVCVMAWGDPHESEVRRRENWSNRLHRHDLVTDRRCLCVYVFAGVSGQRERHCENFQHR